MEAFKVVTLAFKLNIGTFEAKRLPLNAEASFLEAFRLSKLQIKLSAYPNMEGRTYIGVLYCLFYFIIKSITPFIFNEFKVVLTPISTLGSRNCASNFVSISVPFGVTSPWFSGNVGICVRYWI